MLLVISRIALGLIMLFMLLAILTATQPIHTTLLKSAFCCWLIIVFCLPLHWLITGKSEAARFRANRDKEPVRFWLGFVTFTLLLYAGTAWFIFLACLSAT